MTWKEPPHGEAVRGFFLSETIQDVKSKIQWIIGIDEAGRGPIAGPVSVGVCMIPVDFDTAFFSGIRDSKQLSEAKREAWLRKMRAHPDIVFAAALVGAAHIDKKGIVNAIETAMARALARVLAARGQNPGKRLDHIQVLLDGSLRAPPEFKNQQTIIKGDEKIPVISLASIAAKVTRDRHMVRFAKKHPEYGFEVHKGYGTKMHYERVKKHGVSVMHRRSFLRPLTKRKVVVG